MSYRGHAEEVHTEMHAEWISAGDTNALFGGVFKLLGESDRFHSALARLCIALIIVDYAHVRPLHPDLRRAVLICHRTLKNLLLHKRFTNSRPVT